MTKIMHLLAACTLVWSFSSCSKVDYTEIERPAYLRVFNDLNLKIGLENKDEERPFLCMLIDPVIDKDGVPVSAAIKGDFLDQREPYAPPYPSHLGSSTSKNNPEYPGKENVLVGPVLNGFDLSSWAQVPSGKHRIVFYYRPVNEVSFFDLEPKVRSNKVVDTVIDLGVEEVYTMHVLQRNFITKEKGIILRKENFHQLPLSDSMVYVNFYNYSADGFWQADKSLKKNQFNSGVMQYGIRDEMNIWLSICKPGGWNTIPGYRFAYLGQVKRNTGNHVAPYFSFPLFADSASNHIVTDIWQRISLLAPGIDPEIIPHGDYATITDGAYGLIACYGNGTRQNFERGALFLPSMIVNIHSGVYNPRSFATVNTIEVVNGNAYLTTIQRKYEPPVY
ncbi:hypothetical protein SAMN05660909_03746 [Chitinophaga terrae (ex Kim and Jung 2007)]|uniref:Uncharacterized protein n=1 Tax=Chitinophaga terrae (ex Kim and Jung 2007) TaxID=408074 RepID=A0A1H4EHE1_9BACT|nr:hypothetical protein [Chitinophaga terrae (ex Kim and Jung 2007)]GEP91657.1 hypothetical protein CTE07_33020 [Chitinophaga terrae (ex Kim and Jung 2007)]SEA84494.1 hypothetical protein SAMN05660909_03746 [Chitinophaga terrae (ex Kim and Jung 2007)]